MKNKKQYIEDAGTFPESQTVSDSPIKPSITKNVSEHMEAEKPQNNITKRVIRMQFDIEYGGTEGTINTDPKTTMPDLNLKVRQLLENHSRGVEDKTEVRQPLYFETSIPVLNDITDVETYKQHLKEKVQEVDAFIHNERQELQKKESEKKALSLQKKKEDEDFQKFKKTQE